MENLKLKAEAMSCGHCVNAIESAITRLGAKGKANLSDKTVDVSFDSDKINVSQIQEAIEEAGYSSEVLS